MNGNNKDDQVEARFYAYTEKRKRLAGWVIDKLRTPIIDPSVNYIGVQIIYGVEDEDGQCYMQEYQSVSEGLPIEELPPFAFMNDKRPETDGEQTKT